MPVNAIIKRLQNTLLPDTVILSVDYENKNRLQLENGDMIENLPPFYRVRLQMTPGPGSLIHTEVWLPENWNGIFIGTGNGGMAGSIAFWLLPTYLRQNYAVANTDMGNSRGRESGIQNPDVWKDFGWRATHLMTVAAKALIAACYQKPPRFSYFTGGSTGGQQALSLAQRFPEDYDGIIAGVPANNRTNLHTYFLWNHLHLRRANGEPMFQTEEIEAITAFAAVFFQNRGDGEPGDRFVSFPQGDEAVIDAFLKQLAKEMPALQPEQLSALHAVYSGPVNPKTGERIYNGMPIGSEAFGCGINDCQQAESPHYYPFIWAFGKDYTAASFDFADDLDHLNHLLAKDLNANDPDLSAFARHGGKLLIYSGSADPCVPFPDAMRYYQRVLQRRGGYETVKDFCRYFLFPGKDHGNGGYGTNAIFANDNRASDLDALRRWRETDAAPDFLLAVRQTDGKTEFTRRVYPYGSPQFDVSLPCPPACCDRYTAQDF